MPLEQDRLKLMESQLGQVRMTKRKDIVEHMSESSEFLRAIRFDNYWRRGHPAVELACAAEDKSQQWLSGGPKERRRLHSDDIEHLKIFALWQICHRDLRREDGVDAVQTLLELHGTHLQDMKYSAAS